MVTRESRKALSVVAAMRAVGGVQSVVRVQRGGRAPWRCDFTLLEIRVSGMQQPQRPDLRNRRLRRGHARSQEEPRGTEAGWRDDISSAKTGVDEDQSAGVLEEDATGHEVPRVAIDQSKPRRGTRTQRRAVEMMDHRSDHPLPGPPAAST